MKRWLLSTLPLLLAGAGTWALAYSWNHEKTELARWSEEAARLQRSQLVVDIDEVARDQWIIALNQEIAKAEPSADALAAAAEGALYNTLRWQSHLEMRVATSHAVAQQAKAARDAIIDKAQKLADAKDYRALTLMLSQFQKMSKATNSTKKLDDAFFASVDSARAHIVTAEDSMRFWYIAGTAMLLIANLLASTIMDFRLQKMRRQMEGGVRFGKKASDRRASALS